MRSPPRILMLGPPAFLVLLLFSLLVTSWPSTALARDHLSQAADVFDTVAMLTAIDDVALDAAEPFDARLHAIVDRRSVELAWRAEGRNLACLEPVAQRVTYRRRGASSPRPDH